ncbi:hypothetical protein [Chloroflexus sp.]|uniref:hypothetical protein n=1 Tax=Chloroflexus sp. TaxID=1904827 RepID=UPI002ACDB03D|nr:hypothetical protein [Chloroflexus sp.]
MSLFPLPFGQLPIAEPRHLVGHQLLVAQPQFEQYPLVVFAPLGGSLGPRQPRSSSCCCNSTNACDCAPRRSSPPNVTSPAIRLLSC